jgi:hypothetical protein
MALRNINLLLHAILAMTLLAPLSAMAEVRVYEPFDYAVSNNLSVVGTGGTGFAAGWQFTFGEGYVFPANSDSPEAPDWDGLVNNVPTAPAQIKYAGRMPASGTQHIGIYRQLASNAKALAALAAPTNVLWLSVVCHYPNRGGGLWIGLGSGYLGDRARNINTGPGGGQDFMGSSSPTSTEKMTAAIEINNTAVAFDEFPSASFPPTDEDCVVVLKYTFGDSTDTVEGVVFSETNVLTETAFNSHPQKVTATHSPGIDESTFNLLTYYQEYQANALDEIRIGDTFGDVIATNLLGVTDASKSTVVAAPTLIPADGTTMSTVTVAVVDGFSNPLASQPISLTGSTGNAIISPSSANTDANGQVVFTVRSSVNEMEVFTASNTTDSVAIWQTAEIGFQAGTSASASSVKGTWDIAEANEASSSSIIVTLMDAGTALPVAGHTVTLSGSTGHAIITPAGPQVSDANGQVVFQVTSGTAETETFTATDTTDSVVITETFSVTFAPPDYAGLWVYEPFDYPVGALAGQNGGLGFASGWMDAGSAIGWVWDPTNGTVMADSAVMEWDGIITNIPVSTNLGANYFTGGGASVSEAKRDIYRELETSAGEMAGADGVLWMSAVLYRGSSSSVGVGLGLGDTIMSDRGGRLNFQTPSVGAQTALIGTTVNHYGGGGDNRLNAVVATNTVNSSLANLPNYAAAEGVLFSDDDYVLVFKFRFSGIQDQVETYAFPESMVLSEATFNANKITATFSGGFDQNACTLITWSSARGSTCLDEIRIGNTFEDIIGIEASPRGTVIMLK